MSAGAVVVRRRVLLIDDDKDEYLIVGDLLRSFPVDRFELTWAATYAEGLEALSASRFDVCLLDYRLGGQSGLDFLVEARAMGCPTQIVLLTGVADRDVDLQATERGAADYLVKGQMTAELLERSIRYAIERGRVLEALRASEGFLERAGRIAGVGGWSVDLTTDAIHWSNETCRIHDLPPGHRPTLNEGIDYYAPASRSAIESALRECIASAAAFDLELQLVTATGRDIWVRAAGEAQIERGAVVRIFGAFQDITARKLAERELFDQLSERKRVAQALARANERFALAAGAAEIGVWEWDLSSNSLHWDDEMYRLYGRVRCTGEEPYSLWASSLHAEDRERSEREINDALRERKNFDTQFRIVLPTGEIRHVQAAAQIKCDESGSAIRMTGVNFDVTARKRAELDLKETSSLLRRVLDSANDLAIIATTPDHTIRVFNKGAEHLLGYAGAELIDSATAVAFHDLAEVAARGVELTALLGRPVQGAGVFTDPTTLDVPREWTFIRKDQRRVPVLLNISAMFDDSGTLRGFLGVARDITRDREHDLALREAKTQAERANAAKSEFLANMSHEIRTPLSAVIGLGHLLEHTPLNEEQRSFLRKINFAGRTLLAVINNVLDLSKIEAGEMLLEEAELDIVHLVQGVGQMLTPSAHAKGLALSVRCAHDLPRRLCGDAFRLGQIATNLLGNAIKFTATGRIDLELSHSRRTGTGIMVRLSVRDTGIGIDGEGTTRLFRPFSQADTSTTRRFGGTGLGLSIARRVVDVMGGKIGVTSTLGVGSEFWVEVPLRVAGDAVPHFGQAPQAPQATARDAAAVRILSGATILVVDDSDINLEVAGHILRRQGATVTTGGSGAEALERLRSNPGAYDLVFMDVQMPQMDGNEATRRIRKELKLATLPIIALTAGALTSERERSLEAGMNDFLTKPFEPGELIGMVRRYLDRKQPCSPPATLAASIDAPT